MVSVKISPKDVVPCSTYLYAAGFADQLPCARNRYSLGLGATVFRTEAEANSFVEDKVTDFVVLGPYSPEQAKSIIQQQKNRRKRHAASLGMDGKDEWAETYE